MYCKRCGNKINESWKYCPKCQNMLNNETIELDETKIIEKQKKEKKNATIYIIIFFVGIVGMLTIDKAEEIFFIVSLISIVTGFIKCPNSKIIKILFWLFLICIIIAIVLLIVLMFTCANAIANCNYSCPR